MDECHHEHLSVAQVIEDAPRVNGDLTQVRIVDFGRYAPPVGRFCQSVGLGEDLANDTLSVFGRVLLDVVVDGFEIGARARGVQITILASPLLDFAREGLTGHAAAGFDVLHTLPNLVDHIEAIDYLLKSHVVGQPLDSLDGVLLGGVCVHRSLRSVP